MKWATYVSQLDGAERAALYEDGMLYGLGSRDQLIDLIASPDALAVAAVQARSRPFEVVSPEDVRLLSPIPKPPAVRDFMAFENHYVTSMNALGVPLNPVYYEQPVFYFQNPGAVQGPNDPAPIAPGSKKFDYELEVAAIIGRPAYNIAPEDAAQHIAGFTVFCDWSARDLQEPELAMAIGPAKAKDTVTSVGPYLVTAEAIEQYRTDRGFDLKMTASVNGAPYSGGTWSDQYWSFEQLISYAARGTTLQTGDIIAAGTVGTGCLLELSRVYGESAYPWLQVGDEVRLEIDVLGAISATVAEAAPVHELR